MDIAFRGTKMTAGMTRHAIAMENYMQKSLLPEQLTANAMKSLSRWATMTIDQDIACTLFRDYPTYYAELDGLSATEIDERILPMFGRGTLNDVTVSPETFLPNSKTDIEDLDDLDTLSDTFVEELHRTVDQELGMPAITMEDERPFYGMIIGDPDIQNFFRNSSTQFNTTLDSAFQKTEWKHPIYKKFINEFFGVRFVKYGWMSANDGRDEYADHMSVHKHTCGSPYEPRAQLIAAARGDQTIAGYRVWDRGAYDLTTPGNRSGLDGSSDSFNIYVTEGALHFPFYDEDGSSTVGIDSYNAFALTGTETANTYV